MGGPDPMGFEKRETVRKINKAKKERNQKKTLPENGKVLAEIDSSENEFAVVSVPTVVEDKIFASFENKVSSGHSPGRVLHDMKKDGPFENRAVYRKTIQSLVETYLIPPKAETAMIKAGRQKMMAEALVEGDAKTFSKLATLAAKDPELNLQQKSPAISIKIGDLREVLAGEEVIEIDYAEVEAPPEEAQ